MSRRARLAAFLICAGALVAAAATLVVLGPAETPPEATETTSASSGRPEFQELEEAAERREERLEPVIERNGVAEHEEEPPPPAIYGKTQRVAEPVARRFFSAYSLYEIGNLSGPVRRGLTATADPELLEQLLAAPPRVPGGGARPARAELSKRLQLVPGLQEGPQAELTSIELVGEVRREGEEPALLALSMELVDGGRWSVTGLGR